MEPSAIAQQSGKRNIKNITEKKSNEVFVKEHISHCQKLKKGNIRRCSKIKKGIIFAKLNHYSYIHSIQEKRHSHPEHISDDKNQSQLETMSHLKILEHGHMLSTLNTPSAYMIEQDTLSLSQF